MVPPGALAEVTVKGKGTKIKSWAIIVQLCRPPGIGCCLTSLKLECQCTFVLAVVADTDNTVVVILNIIN